MKILYGVVGEGMGHATRSRVVLEHLLAIGHQIHVVVSGRAHPFLMESFRDRPGFSVQEIQGLRLVYKEGGIDKSESFWTNVQAAPNDLRKNLEAYGSIAGRFEPELVISDFESWAYFFGMAHELPIVSIDNMQVINRCRHQAVITDSRCFNFLVSKMAVKAKLPHAYHYLVSSFFYPPVRKRRTTLLPPILRPEILAARREPGEHVLVYQTADTHSELIPLLQRLPYSFRVYGIGEDEERGNVSLRGFSQQGFIDDLRTARAVVAGGGYSLMGEAVHLQVPMLSIPLQGQYEQELNARYLAETGYGRWARMLEEESIVSFLQDVDTHQHHLMRYTPRGNEMLFSCVDELIGRVEMGDPRPDFLESPNLGDYVASQIDEEIGPETGG